ncbi:unnamed protein product [Candidula unifasciata]|uniref:NADH dehydrogenase [ubiquinone] iron-sulfur protein 5 n=1 Tax=Candidula unifasciata TaxID=100452 RepID=A0A8S3YN95_9EUPU|nr:unnamed protein product [Candidula unifasciata]
MLPIIYSPVTKYIASWGGMEQGRCGEFYMDFMRCASRVGGPRAMNVDCVKELADFNECATGLKQAKRYRIIKKERERQNRPYIEPLVEDVLRAGTS